MTGLLLLLLLGPGQGQQCPPIELGSDLLARTSATTRLRFLAQLLEEESDRALLWSSLWGGAYGAMTVTQLAIAPVQGRDDRVDSYIGAVSSAAGVLQLVLLPLTVMEDGHDLVRRSERLAQREGPCVALWEVERRLLRSAHSEALGTSWLAHGGNVIFNLAISAVMGLGYQHWVSAAISLGIGVFIGELAIWTQPDRLSASLDLYRSGRFADAAGQTLQPATLFEERF